MKTIVLAGGRGKRMGILTQNIQKAVLCFGDNPLIVHMLNGLLQESSISDIAVLTGYRGDDVRHIINKFYRQLLDKQRLAILDFPEVKGTLSRLIAGLAHLETGQGCYVCGIDALVRSTVFRRFCSYVNIHRGDIVLSLSPRINIAPTHKLAHVSNDILMRYIVTPDSLNEELQKLPWCIDVGIRYFPADVLNMLRGRNFSQERYIPSFIQELLATGRTIRGFIFQEEWKHFATINDFYGATPLL